MGKLIVLDGLDGSGKSTQAKILEENILKLTNLKVKKISYPNYEENSSFLVREYLKGNIYKDPFKVNAFAATSFFASDHYITYEKNWKKEYGDGYLIIADRYISSNAIHQMTKLKKEKWEEFLQWLYDYETKKLCLPKEDLVIYLNVNIKVCEKLIKFRNKKKDIHEENLQYLKKCKEAAMFSAKKLNYKVIDCDDGENIFDLKFIADKIKEIVLKIL